MYDFFLSLMSEQTEDGRADFCKTAVLSVLGPSCAVALLLVLILAFSVFLVL